MSFEGVEYQNVEASPLLSMIFAFFVGCVYRALHKIVILARVPRTAEEEGVKFLEEPLNFNADSQPQARRLGILPKPSDPKPQQLTSHSKIQYTARLEPSTSKNKDLHMLWRGLPKTLDMNCVDLLKLWTLDPRSHT